MLRHLLSRGGITRISVKTFQQSWKRLWKDASLLLITMVFLAVGCHKQTQTKAAVPPSPPEVFVTEAIQEDVPISSEWIGTTEGNVNAQIRSRVQGYLHSQHYNEGSFVKKGELLFTIDPREYQAALDQAIANLRQAEANFGKTQHDVARYTPLAKEGAISQQELDNAVQANLANRAAVAAAQAIVENAKLKRSWTHITSPIDGIAGISVAQLGDLVTPTTVLTTVSQLDPIKVYFPISEQLYLRVAQRIRERQEGLRSGPTLQLILADGTTYPHQGRIIIADRQVNMQTGTITIAGLFPNPGNLLRPGQYAKVRAVTDIEKGAVLIPQQAVEQVQGNSQVAVVNPDNTVAIRSVKVGEQVRRMAIIEEGVKPGERIIVSGLQKVKAGTTVNAKEVPAESNHTVASTFAVSGK